MEMWEYGFAWGRNGHIYKDIDDRDIHGHKKLHEYISEAGRDGWELCTSLPERDGYMLVFKRRTSR